jgi:hypothetical protein
MDDLLSAWQQQQQDKYVTQKPGNFVNDLTARTLIVGSYKLA